MTDEQMGAGSRIGEAVLRTVSAAKDRKLKAEEARAKAINDQRINLTRTLANYGVGIGSRGA
jgi:hypothetical protein